MSMSVIVCILLGLIAGIIASNKIVSGRAKRAKGNAEIIDFEQADEIATTNIVTPTGVTTVARSNATQSRDLTNTWSQLG